MLVDIIPLCIFMKGSAPANRLILNTLRVHCSSYSYIRDLVDADLLELCSRDHLANT